MPCNFTLVDLMAALSTSVATTSSLVQLRVRDTEKWRQCRHETETGNTRSKQLLMMPTDTASQLRISARRAFEWIRMFEDLAGINF